MTFRARLFRKTYREEKNFLVEYLGCCVVIVDFFKLDDFIISNFISSEFET
jgi:hypothetical protein